MTRLGHVAGEDDVIVIGQAVESQVEIGERRVQREISKSTRLRNQISAQGIEQVAVLSKQLSRVG